MLNCHNPKIEKPDEEIESFWLTFKASILQFLDNEEKSEIDELSNKLNILQKEERYGEIEQYIKNHIEKIGFSIIKQDNGYRAGHLNTNLKRWKKISSKDICKKNNEFYCLFKIYITCVTKYSEYKNNIRELLIKYVIHRESKYLINIINIAIENGFVGAIDHTRHIIDINKFLKEGSNVNIKLCKSSKLIKHLQKIDIHSNIYKA